MTKKAEHQLPRSWVRGNHCFISGKTEYCAFAKPSFGNSEGVAVVTTPERVSKLATGIFSDKGGQTQPSHESVSFYEDAEIPGKGIGLIATKPIRAGQRIMARTPAVMIDRSALDTLSENESVALLVQGVEALPDLHRSRYLNLTTHGSFVDRQARISQIFAVNSFRTWVGDQGADFHSVFTEISRLNHDCRPNCVYYFDPETLSQKVYAVRDIMVGEEITVSYIDGFQSSAARRERLHEHWGFACGCPACTAESYLVAESDSRIEQILKLWAELDDYSPSSTKAPTPEKAELLIELYRLERLEGRLQEAYYRAAIEYLGIGKIAPAMRYARLCIDSGLKFKGPGKPFITSMEDLLRNPKGHKYWMFRVRKSPNA
ncbi:SET domain-containing protein 5 [Apiospora kogelbergensis]|uniref:SET domain-containing protein 5 n=1 Tax=Apiospora kogelbergensis TaxID=1337665 RepID=UPI0031313F0E